MGTRGKLLLLILVVLILVVPLAIAQEETPSVLEQFAQTATALIQARTGTPAPPTAEATLEATEEAAVEPTEEATEEASVAEPTEEATPEQTAETETEDTTARGLPLGVLLFGAVMVLLIGTVVLIRENPRPMDDEE